MNRFNVLEVLKESEVAQVFRLVSDGTIVPGDEGYTVYVPVWNKAFEDLLRAVMDLDSDRALAATKLLRMKSRQILEEMNHST